VDVRRGDVIPPTRAIIAGVERVALAAALVAAVAVAAAVVNLRRRRRSPAPPSQPRRFSVPAQVDRADFDGAEAPWLVALFTSETCDSCERMASKLSPVRSPQVAVQEVSWQERRDLHERYAIEAVPCAVLADADGVVRWSTIGADMTVTDLWAEIATARDGGPAPCQPEILPGQ
jgi:hypothetical protein